MEPEPVAPEPAPEVLDFPLAVPADVPVGDVAVVGRGWSGPERPGAPSSWVAAEVAHRSALVVDAEPGWKLETRPRRGVRPAGSPEAGLLVDTDLADLAAEAAARMLSGRGLTGLTGAEVRRQAQEVWERSQVLGGRFSVLPAASSPWQLDDLVVDGRRAAWWVHQDGLGWAAVADLGAVALVAHGPGSAPAPWSLRLLAPAEAAPLLRDA